MGKKSGRRDEVGEEVEKRSYKERVVGQKEVHSVLEGEQEEMELVLGHPDKTIKVAKGLEGDVRFEILDCIKRNSNVFVWFIEVLTRISPLVAEH